MVQEIKIENGTRFEIDDCVEILTYRGRIWIDREALDELTQETK